MAQTVSIATSTTLLNVTPNPAAVAQTVTLRATFTGALPNGTVTFSDGATILGTSTIAAGQATLSLAFPAIGTHSLKAVYTGDANNSPSTSTPVSLSVITELITFFHNDISGTPMAETDASGNLVWKESYRPYGDPVQPPNTDNKLWFTGKPYDKDNGLTYMGARYYDPLIGRFMGTDPKGFDPSNIHSFNRYAYANNNPEKFVDPDGRSGQLVIEASGNGGSFMADGHSWLVFTKDGTNATTTWGTWGNNPENLGNGLHANLEAGRTGDATRGTHIDDAQEQLLMNKISEYQKMGADAWQYGAPCSKFSSDTWNTVTGEKLDANWGPINNPTTLKESIVKANGGAAHSDGITPNGRKSSDSSTGLSSSSASSGSSLNSAGSLLQ